jgi:L-fucose isomerase-like protein
MLKDIGYPAACENDVNALLAMMIQMYTSRKAAYMGNPDIDIKNNTLHIKHSVASLKMNGLNQPDTPYDIVSFAKAGFGVTLRHDFKENLNKVMTIARFNPFGNSLLLTRGSIIDGVTGDGCGCDQSVTLQIPDGDSFFDKQQNYGHHLSLVYGDYCEQIKDLGDLMGFEVELVI